MRISVVADDTGAVNAKHKVQPLQRRVVDEHVIRTLQKARVDRSDRLEPLLYHAAGHRNGMPLGNADVIQALGMRLGKRLQPRSGQHGRRDGDDGRVFVRKLRKRLTEHVRKIRLRRRQCAGHRVERADTVVFFRRLLGIRDAPALLRHHVQQHRLTQVARPAQHFLQLRLIVPVDRSDVIKAHVVKHIVRQDKIFHMLLDVMQYPIKSGRFSDSAAIKPLKMQIPRLDTLLRQKRCHAADVFVDRHAVVIEHDDHRLTALPGVRQPLVGQAACQRTVTDEGNDVIILPHERARPRHTQRNGDRRGGMACYECIVHTFVRLREAGDTAELPQRRKRFAPPGQELVHIALVSDVEYEPVALGIVDTVDCDRKLHRAEVRGEMPAGFRETLHQERTKFRTQLRNFSRRQRLQVSR